MPFAIKAGIPDPDAAAFTFPAHKTMYAGKRIAVGDVVFLFASETQGGRGLVARGIVTAAEPVPKRPGPSRQTPRVTLTIRRKAHAVRPLGRVELKPLAAIPPGAELHFKLYRQATNKVVGLSDAAAVFLGTFFERT